MSYYTGECFPYGTHCAGEQPGAVGAMAWYLAAYGSKGATSMGIVNCVAGSSTFSIHSEGRAMDFGTPMGVTEWSQKLAYALVNMSKELGVQLVIHNREMWICGPSQAFDGFLPYTGIDDHTSHLHVELTREMAAKPAAEVTKLWNTQLAKASIERPGKTDPTTGKGVGADGGGGAVAPEEEAKEDAQAKDLQKGIPGESDLEGMSNYKKRLEAEKQLSSGSKPIEEKSVTDLTISEQKKLAALGEDVNSGKTGVEMANIGVSAAGVGIMLFTTLLFGLFLLDRTNTLTEGRALKTATMGRLAVAYDKEDEGKDSSGTNYVGWGGILKYSAVGIILGLILVSGAFFSLVEHATMLWGDWFASK